MLNILPTLRRKITQLVALGGTTDSNGNDAGSVVIGASSNLTGAEQLRHMIATIDTGTPTGQADIIDDATGFKVFTATIDPSVTLAAGESIVVGYGITSSDTGVETNAKNCSVEIGGVRSGSAFTDVVVLNANKPTATVVYDGTNTIKRIVPVTSDAADRAVTITTVG